MVPRSPFHMWIWGHAIWAYFEIMVQHYVRNIEILEKALRRSTSGTRLLRLRVELVAETAKGAKRASEEIKRILKISQLPPKIAEVLNEYIEEHKVYILGADMVGEKGLVTQWKEWAKDFKKPILATVSGAMLLGACTIATDCISAVTARQQLIAMQAANQNSAMANQQTMANLISNQVLSSDGRMVQIPGAAPIPFASLARQTDLAPAMLKSSRRLLEHQETTDWKKAMTTSLKNRRLRGEGKGHGRSSLGKGGTST